MFSALRRTVALLVVPAAVVAFAGPASAATSATPQPVVAPATTGVSQQGIIMSDGRICNPRWGC